MISEIDLDVGDFYYAEEEAIYPAGDIYRWLYQLREKKNIRESSDVVFTVLISNKESFCNPGLNIADVSFTSRYWIFKSSTCRIFKRVTPCDFKKYLNFQLTSKSLLGFVRGPGRIYYNEKLAQHCPIKMLPLLIGKHKKLDKEITLRLGA